MKVLIAGAAGRIGRVLAEGLATRRHEVIGLDRVPSSEDEFVWHVADCSDPWAVHAVFELEQPEAVVHVAGHPAEDSLPASMNSHVVTTAALLEASLAQRVRRFVYASSNHAVGLQPRSNVLSVDVRPRPDTFYGVAKVAAEALLSLYADRHGLDTVACRIGSFRSEPDTTRALSTWLSHDDCVRMFDACLTAKRPGFVVVYGISANSRAWWDLDPGRALGYFPEDDAEEYANQVPARPGDEREAAFVGGPLATEAFLRPAFADARYPEK